MSDSAARVKDWKADLPSRERSNRDRRFDGVRVLLVAGWVVVLVFLPFAAERTSSWGHLRHLVSNGAVTHVEVNGELPRGAEGFATVDLHWRSHGLGYVARVVQERGADAYQDCLDDDACFDASDTTLHAAPSERLLAVQPGLEVTRHERGRHNDAGFLGFSTPWPVALAGLALSLGALVVLIGGPQPWRATRWAYWWWFQNPIGIAALLLLSGPFPGVPAPRNLQRRLTGGWSFLLSVFVSSVTFSLWSLTL